MPANARTLLEPIKIGSFGKLPREFICSGSLMIWHRFDELHPSMQAERVVAQAMSDVKHRRTEKWTTDLS
ncbi:hypothetical protein C8Q74DRAFT_1243833 [Fomes fomentarius]|nr:hypothetical protein C8Q74DRAFT_1243833 [Fomes fomentarius]